MLNPEQVEEVEQRDIPQSKEQAQKVADTAFASSGVKRTIGSLTFQPFSASREAAAQAMGLHYAHVDKAGQERFRRTKLYPGAIRDVAVFSWLCVKATDDEIEAAGIEPRAASKVANEWARASGLFDINSDLFLDVYGLFFEVMDNIWASRTVPVQKKITTIPQQT